MDGTLITETLTALDELLLDIMGLALSVAAIEPKPGNIVDRLDQSTECLELVNLILRHHELLGFSALIQTQIEKNHVALRLSSNAGPPD